MDCLSAASACPQSFGSQLSLCFFQPPAVSPLLSLPLALNSQNPTLPPHVPKLSRRPTIPPTVALTGQTLNQHAYYPSLQAGVIGTAGKLHIISSETIKLTYMKMSSQGVELSACSGDSNVQHDPVTFRLHVHELVVIQVNYVLVSTFRSVLHTHTSIFKCRCFAVGTCFMISENSVPS